MRKLTMFYAVLIFLFAANVSQVTMAESVPKLRVVEVEKLMQIDDNTGLFFGLFLQVNDNDSRTGGLYIFNTDGKYKFIALYLRFETDEETFILYTEKPIKIGPIGPGSVKEEFVSYSYSQEESGDFVIVFKHYQDFNKKEGRLITEYKINLTKLAKELV